MKINKRKQLCMLLVISFIFGMLPGNIFPYKKAKAADYNYGEALQKAIMFYEFQRSGKLPADKRDNWRGDSGLQDGADEGLDLTGGWYDAGDHVKFNLPMAYSQTMLAWAVYEAKGSIEKSGQLPYLMDDIRWVSDYLIKCHPSSNVFYYQVGSGSADHAWWGPAEVMQMKRPGYKVTLSAPGSSVVGEAAAALASAAIVFRESDPSYAEKCIKHAKELYTFADTAKSDSGYTEASGYYNSFSGFYDELSWAGAWLYLATKDKAYLTKAENYVDLWAKENQTDMIAYKWAHSWDDKHHGATLLLARITDKDIYKEAMERHLDYWTTGYDGNRIKYTPKGLAWCDQWGSLRYATTEAFLASVYADWSGCTQSKVSTYRKFAKSQVDYALGSTGHSFVVGFGKNPPEHPHHRTAHSSWADSQTTPAYHRHVIYGALVGGPGSDDSYADSIGNYVDNEIACDYNAGFVGALAKLYGEYGGTPIKNLTAIEKVTNDEYFVEAGINASGANFIEIKALMNNQTGWPARMGDKLSFRYFVDISEAVKAGYDVGDFTVTTNYNNGATVSGLLPWNKEQNIYYVKADFTGAKIYPGGQGVYKREVQIRIAAPQNTNFWNNANDYSYHDIAGVTSGKAVKTQYIPVYDDGKMVYGQEPGASVTPTVTPVVSATPTVTVTPVVSITPTVTPAYPQKGKVKLAMYNGNVSTSANGITPRYQLTNTGDTDINLSEVKIRYYYTIDGEKKQSFWCDWSDAGSSNVTGTFVKMDMPKENADYYLEIGFLKAAGTLKAGKSIEIEPRFSKTDWTAYHQSNDYSFDGKNNGYTECTNSTVFILDQLQSGIEP